RARVDDLAGLEDAVPHGQSVVEHRHRRLVGRQDLPVHPYGHAHFGPPVATVARGGADTDAVPAPDLSASVASRPARATSRRAFSTVSSHSPSGSEPQVMPAPVPNQTRPRSSQKVRMPTARQARPRSASTQPTAPQ